MGESFLLRINCVIKIVHTTMKVLKPLEMSVRKNSLIIFLLSIKEVYGWKEKIYHLKF